MIGIIGAMDEEIAIIKNKLTNVLQLNIAHVEFFQGELNNKPVVLLKSGIGKVNAAISTTLLLERFQIDYIINIGTAGGVTSDCDVLDIVISNKVAYHDVDVTAFNYAYGQVPKQPLYFTSNQFLIAETEKVLQLANFNYHKGLIVSGDAFISRIDQIEKIKNLFPNCIAVEMEACAIAHVCQSFNKPFIILRSLSDIAGKESNLSFDKYINQAALNSSIFVEKLINIL